MKRWALVAAVLMAAPLGFGQSGVGPGNPSRHSPDCDFSFTFTAAGRSTYASLGPAGPVGGTPPVGYDNRSEACTTWTLAYSSTGFTVVSIELDEAPDAGGVPGSWVVHPNPAGGTALPLTSTSQGQATCYRFFPWLSVNVNTATGVGTIKGRVMGYRPFTDKDASLIGGASAANVTDVQGTAAAGVPPVGNPVLIGGWDTTNVQTLRTDTNGQIQIAGVAGATLTDVITNSPRAFASVGANFNGFTSYGLLFNGVSWDRARAATADSGRTGNLEVTRAHSFTNVLATTATTVKGTAGILHRIIVNTPIASATIKIANLASASCTGSIAANAGTFTIPSVITSESPFSVEFDAIFSAGICVQASSAALDYTVISE